VKKNDLALVLTLAAFLVPATVFAAGPSVKDTTGGKSAAPVASSKTLLADELPATGREAAKEEELATGEIKTVPAAAVSNTEKNERTISDAKSETSSSGALGETLAKKPSVIPAKKERPEEAPVKKEISSTLNTAEMQKRWKALFSKEITPDSEAYAVQPGDSLYVLAKKHHTTVDFIKKINDLKSDNIYPKMKLKIHTAPFLIRIDKSKNILVLYSNDEAVKKYSVATGKKNSTPVGEFKIMDKLVHPTWFKTGAILPPGSPENALGTRWMGFDKPAYGIHGTIEPKSIGTQASEGCIRMLNEDVEELYSIVPVGTQVIIQD
jgi:lipoprotein-anchoring transpeptidase ErfK/SrfK